jgi:hypothetical protein
VDDTIKLLLGLIVNTVAKVFLPELLDVVRHP